MRKHAGKLLAAAAGIIGLAVGGVGGVILAADTPAAVDKLDQIIELAEAAKADLSEPTEAPTLIPTDTPPPSGSPADEFPTPDTTGPRHGDLTASGSVVTSTAGQIIENREITGRLTIRHSNTTVRDVLIHGTGTYMVHVDDLNGTCPTGVRIEYVEIDGTRSAENDIPIYLQCGAEVDHAHVHSVGRSSRLTSNATVTNSYIISDRTGDSGAHRGGIGLNGGSDNRVENNVLKCEGAGCSAALPMYGDFAPVTNYLVKHNLFATTGSYCAYGGSLDSKPYPDASNVDFIDNHFSREYFPTCGRYGPIAGYEGGVRGNEWRGNVWHETGEPLNLG